MAGTRQLTLSIDLGGEQILLDRVEAVEAMARPFSVTVDLFSELAELDLLPHLGKPAAVRVSQDEGAITRWFHGLVTEGEFLSEHSEGFKYRIVLRPFTYFLAQNRNYAIFQEQSAVDIIKKIIADRGLTAQVTWKISNTYRSRVYCVQYGESDFAFISRLMEEEGLYYYFSHDAGKHVMVVCDAPSAHPAGLSAKMGYNPALIGHSAGAAASSATAAHHIHRWHERVLTGGESHARVRDWDFERPQKPLEAIADATSEHPRDVLEVYEWPAGHMQPAEGKQLAKAILDARRADRRTYSGETHFFALEAGTKFTLGAHPNRRFNRGYVVTRAHHLLVNETHRSGRDRESYGVLFEAIPDDVVFASPHVTPRPVVRGPETAIVTGPSGETIHTDKYGRIMVRFHWDRANTAPEKSTCWIRVSQTGGLGNIILPRVGHEVIVDFLDGDPDRPVVTGRVFNADKGNMPVYPLPEHKTRALWRTKSYTSGGGTDDVGAAKPLDIPNPSANELRFEDKIGKEELFLHAQRDMNTRIRRNETYEIGLDQTGVIHGARKVTIDETDVLDVKKSIKITAGTTIEMEAQTSITFKVGKSTVKLEPAMITINTAMYKMEASGMAEMKSPMTTVKGDGMLTLKGGITMIN